MKYTVVFKTQHPQIRVFTQTALKINC